MVKSILLIAMLAAQAQTPPPKITPPKRITPTEEAPAMTERPDFRVTRPGEQRSEGLLQRIECGLRGAITLRTRVDDKPMAFTADALRDIDFVVYGPPRGPVTCGGLTPPPKVYVTWRPLTPAVKGIAGRAVAVEFLPAK